MTKIKKTAQIIAYESIRESIINGEFAGGGMKLVEEKLAIKIGVSRTPIRDAIRRLEQEGFINNKKVIKPTETDLRNQFEMRMLIESYAASKAASYMIDDDIAKLKNAIHIARISEDNGEVIKQNKEFHDLIVLESRNPIMIETVNRMQSIIYLFSRAVVLHKRPGLIDEHEEILKAIIERDPEMTSQKMKEHLHSDLEFTLRIIK
ncbi:transcriptional regulator [Gracilibacillus boraciitolerans JCM 21714]|uniref:Transcriptional regulator n=1 Tax=Gracilibacillus boraciitolerans JCM 21714 TaxID=1298598 RepID=W4VQZ1_9BACI|nr:GntR family transcriptional regulator [Gracilibacillus boraciitolerans]GAE95399.1 transcriptional regulator [Gracilibacillus boraciitolerans JCM 21714]